MLRELAELGMALARAAAQQALQDWAPPTVPAEALAATAVGIAGDGRVRPDPGLLFDRLSRAVRQTIALEARVAAGDFGPARRPAREGRRQGAGRGAAAGLDDDDGLATVRRVLHAAADAGTEGGASAGLHRDIDERLQDLSDRDQDDALSFDEIITAVCDDLGINFDASRLPDDVLEPACREIARSDPDCRCPQPAAVPACAGAGPDRSGGEGATPPRPPPGGADPP